MKIIKQFEQMSDLPSVKIFCDQLQDQKKECFTFYVYQPIGYSYLTPKYKDYTFQHMTVRAFIYKRQNSSMEYFEDSTDMSCGL